MGWEKDEDGVDCKTWLRLIPVHAERLPMVLYDVNARIDWLERQSQGYQKTSVVSSGSCSSTELERDKSITSSILTDKD